MKQSISGSGMIRCTPLYAQRLPLTEHRPESDVGGARTAATETLWERAVYSVAFDRSHDLNSSSFGGYWLAQVVEKSGI
jgi:hypothetical protein